MQRSTLRKKVEGFKKKKVMGGFRVIMFSVRARFVFSLDSMFYPNSVSGGGTHYM